jgi:hypothetical protein
MDKTTLYPLAPAAGNVGAKFCGLSVPDWVGIATIVYLVIMAGIALHKHFKEPRDGRKPRSD